MRRFDDIIAGFIEASLILKSKGLEKHAQDLDARADALIELNESTTSRAHPTSDTGRTVTAKRSTPQERAEFRRIRTKYKNRRPARKRVVCCKKMERRKTRKGYVWGAVCHFIYKSGKRSGSMGAQWTVASTGNRKPMGIVKEGKRIPVCRSGQIERLKKKLSK